MHSVQNKKISVNQKITYKMISTPNNQCSASPTNGINGIKKVYGNYFHNEYCYWLRLLYFAKLKASRKNCTMCHQRISMQKMTSNGHFIQPKLKLIIAKNMNKGTQERPQHTNTSLYFAYQTKDIFSGLGRDLLGKGLSYNQSKVVVI